jgi:hypothetical protein
MKLAKIVFGLMASTEKSVEAIFIINKYLS